MVLRHETSAVGAKGPSPRGPVHGRLAAPTSLDPPRVPVDGPRIKRPWACVSWNQRAAPASSPVAGGRRLRAGRGLPGDPHVAVCGDADAVDGAADQGGQQTVQRVQEDPGDKMGHYWRTPSVRPPALAVADDPPGRGPRRSRRGLEGCRWCSPPTIRPRRLPEACALPLRLAGWPGRVPGPRDRPAQIKRPCTHDF